MSSFALISFYAILATRMAYAEEDPMKGLEHAETLLRLSETTGQRRYVGLAKTYIGMNRWCLGALDGTDRIMSGTFREERRLMGKAWAEVFR